jgi:hypothetical protein
LERYERLTDGVIEYGQDDPRAECIGLLAQRVDLVGLAVSGDCVEALSPRWIVLALRGAQLEDQVAHDTSTGAPEVAEA